jgi:radical SAM superfamily enzyme YgiQ (UPF0313 family)
MKILLVHPQHPATFWRSRHIHKFTGHKADYPPLELLTLAALLPGTWKKRLIDMNLARLTTRDLRGADYVFISALSAQRQSAREVIEQCRLLGAKIVAGGPLFTTDPEDFPEVDHLVLGAPEISLPLFLADLRRGALRRVYTAESDAQRQETPVPLWDLVKLKDYAAMKIRVGPKSSRNDATRLLAELECFHSRGWHGPVLFVDDDLRGDKSRLKDEILPRIIAWMIARDYPFYFIRQAASDRADDPQLLELMGRAGFKEVFFGSAGPHENRLLEGGKPQNRAQELLASVNRIQHAGLQVHSSFIDDFERKPATLLQRQLRFIQESGIPPWSERSLPDATPSTSND